MLGRNTLLASTALVASLALAGCFGDSNNAGGAGELDVDPVYGVFGLEVGVPVNLISATRGDGVSFDKFSVTFNNLEGTDITLTTPEGETINFTEADLEWLGSDPDLGGMEIARLTSSRGDRLDVTLGSATVPLPPPPEPLVVNGNGPETEDVAVVALGRLDEVDTRNGFETYGVIGQETDPGALPRYQEDVIVFDGEGRVPMAAGELALGTASYSGEFLASVFKEGELVTDEAMGEVTVGIDLAGDYVTFAAEGGYTSDDVDDLDGILVDVNSYSVSLYGTGDATDLSLSFEDGVQYSGTIEGDVEIPLLQEAVWEDGSEIVPVTGEFGGAVYGPGSDWDTVDAAEFGEVVDATATAGVFEAGSEGVDGGDPNVQIVGGYIAEDSDFSANDYGPAPTD